MVFSNKDIHIYISEVIRQYLLLYKTRYKKILHLVVTHRDYRGNVTYFIVQTERNSTPLLLFSCQGGSEHYLTDF